MPENIVDVAPGQTGISRSASAVSSLALKSPLYAQPPVSSAVDVPVFDHDGFLAFAHHICLQTPSVDSFGSAEEVHEGGLFDDHVTQMRHISGKPSISKTVGGMISRTISTRRSKINNLKVVNSQNLFIGVSVTEHEQELEAGELENEPEAAKKVVTATVHAPLKKQPSKRNMGSSVSQVQVDWIGQARKFGRKIRRKSQAWLSGPTGQGSNSKPVASSSSTPSTAD